MCCKGRKLSEKAIKIIETTVFVVTLVVVASLFTLPIIFYYISVDSVTISNNNSFPGTNETMPSTEHCATLTVSWSQQYSSSDCIQYTGSVCHTFLSQWNLCTVGNGDIRTSAESQNQDESTIVQLNTFLSNYLECQQVAIPFLCQYNFPLHDCTGKLYTASRDDCISISTGVCANLWKLATNFGYGHLLPNCYNLPNSSVDIPSNKTAGSSINNVTNDTLNCREDFIQIDSICEPRCDSFEQGTHTESLIMIYAEIVAGSIALILSIAAIILSIKDYKTMLIYPSILVVFQVIDTTVVASLALITAVDRNKLYCSSVSLLETLENPAPFCTLTGALFHYTIMNMMLWWFFNLAVFFHKVMFPFQANRLEKLGRNKYIFAVLIFFGLVLPLPAVVISLSVKRYKYTMHRFPTALCTSNGDMWFYSTTLPIDLLVAAGILMLIIVVWNIRKSSHLFKKTSRIQLTTAEKKIMLFFTSFLIFSIFTLGHISESTAKADEFFTALSQYFICEAFGHFPGKCDRGTFDKINSPYMNAIAYTLMGLIPLSILNFIVKWASVKEVVKRIRMTIRRHSKYLFKHGSVETSTGSAPTTRSSAVSSQKNPLYTRESEKSIVNSNTK